MTKPMVSIITVTFNHEEFIQECIESVLDQTFPDWEQIIVDDGSTDKTPKRIAQYGDSRIHYVRQNNAGIMNLSNTYNKALHLSRGEFVAILEGDDFWPPDKLEKQLATMGRPEVVLSWGKIGIVNEKSDILGIVPRIDLETQQSANVYQNKPPGQILQKLLFEDIIPAVSVIIRKSSVLSIGGFQQPPDLPTTDYPTWLNLALKGEFSVVDSVLGYWRRHHLQATLTRNMELARGVSRLSSEYYDSLDKHVKTRINVSREQIAKHNRDRIPAAYFHRGRVALIKQDWAMARSCCMKAILQGNLSTKLKGVAGLLASFLHMDLEALAKLAGRGYLPKVTGESQ